VNNASSLDVAKLSNNYKQDQTSFIQPAWPPEWKPYNKKLAKWKLALPRCILSTNIAPAEQLIAKFQHGNAPKKLSQLCNPTAAKVRKFINKVAGFQLRGSGMKRRTGARLKDSGSRIPTFQNFKVTRLHCSLAPM